MGILIEDVSEQFDSLVTVNHISRGVGIWLILTNPYAYKHALNRALETAQRLDASLNVVFVIEPNAVTKMVNELTEDGWLITGSLQNLQAELMAGYRVLARDVLNQVQGRVSQVGFTIETAIEEASLSSYIQDCLSQQNSLLIVNVSKSRTADLEPFLRRVEWIEED